MDGIPMDGFISFIKDINKNENEHDKRPLRLGEAHPGFKSGSAKVKWKMNLE